MKGSVTVHMAAPPERVWALLSDVTQIGRFSPETFEAEWLDGASGPEVGARFRGHVKRNERGPTYWTECEVTTCERGRSFGFDVKTRGRTVNTWRYDLEPGGDGTDVTESFALADNPATRIYWLLAGRWRARTNEQGMRTTLERVRDVVEGDAQQ